MQECLRFTWHLAQFSKAEIDCWYYFHKEPEHCGFVLWESLLPIPAAKKLNFQLACSELFCLCPLYTHWDVITGPTQGWVSPYGLPLLPLF